MASQSFYRKWRSQTFSDLIGQEAVTRTLLNAVRDGRLAHAYLFCGPRGTGKTSAARLLAKAVNCANPHNGEPCNECVSCREITAGRSPDVIEIDAASNTGVDNIRDLRDNVALLGSGGHYKVYVVDEVHMLSTAAFNALLKTLEEPPPHVIFVLATTEAQKVLATVVSRCQRFDFRRFSMRDLVGRLNQVAQGEGLTLEPAAAELLARSAQGGMRDALSLLDQAVAFCGAEVTYERIRQMLGLADATALRTLIAHVAAQRAAEGLDLINDLVASGADLRQLNTQLIEEWRALMLARAGADVARLMDRTDDDGREIVTLANQFTLDQLMTCARIFTRNEGPARGLPIPQLALELVFLECVSACDPARPLAVAPTLAPSAHAALPAPTSAPTHAAPAQSAAYTPAYTPPAPTSAPSGMRPQPPATPQPPIIRPIAPPTATLDLARIDQGESAQPALVVAPALAATTPAPTDTEHAAAGDDEWGDISEYDAAEAWEDVDETPPLAPAPVRRQAPRRDEAPSPISPVNAGAVAPDRDWLSAAQQRWTLIKKVCKQRPGQGATVGALLNHAYPILMEPGQPGEAPTLILQAKYKFHAEGLRDPVKREIIEWALEQTLEAPIRVRVVLEGAAVGPGVTVGRGAPAQAAAPSRAATQPTPLRAAPADTANTPGASAESAGFAVTQQYAPASSAPERQDGAGRPSQPTVREGRADSYAPTANGHSAQNGQAQHGHGAAAARPAPAQRALEEQARADPVVQELARLLGAEVAEVRSLDAPDGDDPV